MQFPDIDIALLEKYGKPGPRYTSYPTAPIFSEDFAATEFTDAVVRSNSESNPPNLSLYYHIPFCDTLCYFCGCTMMVTKNRGKINNYLDYLRREMDLVAPLISRSRKVTQLHWGGGTPSILDPDEILELSGMIREKFTFADDDAVEASCEIDPRELTFDHLKALRDGGFNRLSMGVQDFNDKVQKTINRIQPEKMTRDVVDWSRQLGFKSINLDFIYGLPYQTTDSFEKTVDVLIDIAPERIAVFNYAHVPWLKKHQSVIREDTLPEPRERLMILKKTIEKLSRAGYRYIGMDHFAKPDDELAIAQENKTLTRNFQGYSTQAGCDLYAFGMSGISQLRDCYAQNHKTLPSYYEAVDGGLLPTAVGYQLSDDDKIRQRVIMKIMSDFEIRPSEIAKEFNIDFASYFAASLKKLEPFVEDGLVRITDDVIEVVNVGRLVIRNIAMCFDWYLEQLPSDKKIFSKTV